MSMGDGDTMQGDHKVHANAFWNGFLEGLSGPLLMSVDLKVPVPKITKEGKWEIITGLSASEAFTSGRVNSRLAITLRRTASRVLRDRGIIQEVIREMKDGSDGKKYSFKRVRLKRKATDDESVKQS